MKSLKDNKQQVDFIRTGSTLLNMALSCYRSSLGGLPTRRITEISGTTASGKTYVLGELCGSALRGGYTHVVVDDVERRWDLTRLSIFGINIKDKRFQYIDKFSKTLEDCFETMFKKMDKLKPHQKMLYIVDPIAALNSRKEVDPLKDMGKRAKVLQFNMRCLRDRMGDRNKNITVVFANQLIDNVGVMFGPKKITPGGNALLHWPSVKIRFASAKPMVETKTVDKKAKKIVRGVHIKASIPKNSEDDPFREACFTIRYGYGIDDIYDCVMWLKEFTVKVGSEKDVYKFKKKKFKDVKKFIKFLEKKNLEKSIFKLTRKYYKRWYKPTTRKKKVF